MNYLKKHRFNVPKNRYIWDYESCASDLDTQEFYFIIYIGTQITQRFLWIYHGIGLRNY